MKISSKTPPITTKQFFENASAKLGVKTLDDWYSVNPKSLSDLDEHGIFQKECRGSLYKGLSKSYPDYNWLAWKFQQYVPKGYWLHPGNQRKFFDWFAVKNNLPLLKQSQLSDADLAPWYKLTKIDVLNAGGKAVLETHKGSLCRALQKAYPSVQWHPWRFGQVPKHYWKDNENRKMFFSWLGEQLKVQKLDDWYNVTTTKMMEICGYNLMDVFGGSLVKALQTVYPEHDWLPWKFVNTPHNWWKQVPNQKKYVEWLAIQLGIKEQDDWYKVKPEHFAMNCGATLMVLHKYSVANVLATVYPEREWKHWKFDSRVPKGFYKDPANVTALLNEIATQLDVTRLDDWYRVSRRQLHSLKAGSLVVSLGGITKLLKMAYPSHPWDFQKLRYVGKKSSQRHLKLTLQKLFPGEEILEDYLHPKLVFSSKQQMQLDVFLPSLSLAFEYQGQQHYQDISVFSPQVRYQDRDSEKKQQCLDHKITLIEVPFWWDHKPESLAASIKQLRPELLPHMTVATPISLEQPRVVKQQLFAV